MLPSGSLRALALFGIICCCVGLYLSDWGVPGAPVALSKALEGLGVLALLGTRAMPRAIIDDQALRASVGASAVNRLSVLRGVALAILVFTVLPAFFVTPLVYEVTVRRTVLVGCAAILLGGIATLGFVEVKYRGLVREAGLPVRFR